MRREQIDRWITASVLAFAGFVPLSIAGEQVALGFLILGLGLRAFFLRESPRPTGPSIFDAPLLLHAATLAISVALTTIPEVSGGERLNLWRLIALVALSAALDRDRELTRRAVGVLLGVLFFVSLYAILQHYTGLDLTRSGDRAVAIPADFRPGRFRPTGTFNWYSTLAFVLATGLAFAFALALESRRGLRHRLFYLAASGPALLALAFTQVRATWIGLAGGFLIGALLRGRRTLLWVLVVGSLASGSVLAVSPAVRDKAASTFDLAYRNNAERVFMWARALEMIADRPGTGIGHGAYTPATAWYYDRWDAEFPVRCHAHNNFLHFWATAGPLALLCYLWIFVAFFRHLVPAYREARRRGDGLAAGLGLGALVAVIGFLLASLFQDPYFDGEVFYGAVFALAVGGAVVRWSRPGGGDGLRAPLIAVLVGTLVGLAQGPALLDLDPLDPNHGVGGSLLIGSVVVFLGAIKILLRERPSRWPPGLLTDTFLWSLGLTALTTLLAPWVIVEAIAPRLQLTTAVSPWLGLSALPPLLVAAALYLLLARPGRLGRTVSLLAVGAVVTVAWHGLGPGVATPPAVGGPSPTVETLSWAPDCRGVVVSRIGLLTTAGCAARVGGALPLGGREGAGVGDFACERAAIDLPGQLAFLRCRSLAPGRDLRDLPAERLPRRGILPGLTAATGAWLFSELDRDRDGIPDPVDGCAAPDPTQTDTDRDGVTDACEPIRLLAPLGPWRFVGAGGKGEVFDLLLGQEGEAPALRLAAPARERMGDQPLSGLAAVRFEAGADPLVLGAAELPGDLRVLQPGQKARTVGAFQPRSGWVGLAAAHLPEWASGSPGGELLVGARQRQPSLVVYDLGTEGELETLGAAPMEGGAAEVLALGVGDLGGDGYDELLLLRGGDRPRLTVYRLERGHRVLREAGSVEIPDLRLGGPEGARVTILSGRRRVRLYDRQGFLHDFEVGADEEKRLRFRSEGARPVGPPAHWVIPEGRGLLVYRVKDPSVQRVPLPGPGRRGAR